jgi:hypothetical protein
VSKATGNCAYWAVQVDPIVELMWLGKELVSLVADYDQCIAND